MFYYMYLTSVCKRRSWPEPQFTPFATARGYGCVVRVNNREYSTGSTVYESVELAKNAAAQQAYMICRNFSVNDGMMPGQHPGVAAASTAPAQGLPVAIGAGRQRRTTVDSNASGDYASSSGSSGAGSPRRLSQSDLAYATPASSSSTSRRHGHSDRRGSSSVAICQCRRAPATGYGRCLHCLREQGYVRA